MSHTDCHDLLYAKQFGFRKMHSMGDVINVPVGEILKSQDKNMNVLAVFIDLKKVFDTVSHEVILEKLEKPGIRGSLLDWFMDYLQNRY